VSDETADQTQRRDAQIDWATVEEELGGRGYARLPRLLGSAECSALVEGFGDESRFRSFVEMERYRYGKGDYRYFANPLPTLIESLRHELYRPLAAIANRWEELLGTSRRYPTALAAFLDQCHEAGQTRPTPLLLHYEEDGFNCLHQDRYGEVAFPLQVVVLLSNPGQDFQGGELLLTEQRPRMQSRGEAITLSAGEGLVFPNQTRPVKGLRGHYRANVRHGVSRLHAGERYALGIIFHDAE
jgi:hypothetical protein